MVMERTLATRALGAHRGNALAREIAANSPPLLPKRDDLPRGSQGEGRRHGGRRPIKVYAFTLMPATGGWSSGDEGPSL